MTVKYTSQDIMAARFIPDSGVLGYAPLDVGEVAGDIADYSHPVLFAARYAGSPSAKVNKAIQVAKAEGGGIVVLPYGSQQYDAAINMADLGEVPISLVGQGAAFTAVGTTLVGNTGSCVIDTQGSANIALRDFRIRVPNTLSNPALVGINQGRTVSNPSAALHNWRRLQINMDSNASLVGHGDRGAVGIYNIGSEQGYYEHVRVVADLPLFMDTIDALGFPGPYGGAHNGVSMSFVTFVQAEMMALKSNCVELANCFNICLRDFSFHRALGSSTKQAIYARVGCDMLYVTGQIEDWDSCLLMGGFSRGFDIDVEISLLPQVPQTEPLVVWANNNLTFDTSRIKIQQLNGTTRSLFGGVAGGIKVRNCEILLGNADGAQPAQFIDMGGLTIEGGTILASAESGSPSLNSYVDVNPVSTYQLISAARIGVSADRGDTSVTLDIALDKEVQHFATALTANRTVSLPTAKVWNGAKFRIVRTGLGAGTLDVNTIKTIPANTAAFIEVTCDGTLWYLTGYGLL